MKIQSLILSVFVACNGYLHADGLSTQNTPVKTSSGNSAFFKKITPEMLYGYTDFHFDSTEGVNFNQFNGHSNLYSGGADHISLGSNVMAGIYYFRIDTVVNSQFTLSPTPLTTSEQTIKNNTIFGHVLKIFTPQIYLDVAGGYGYNQLSTFTVVDPDSPDALFAQAHNNNNNWFVSANGIYRKTWQKFLLRANLGVLYSRINTDSYDYLFPATNTLLTVAPLVNKATLIMENAELGYFIRPKLMPFINGGLFQVVQFSNSRPILDAASIVNGTLPQLNMDRNGFRLGGGIAYNYKNVSLRVEEKYYNAGGTFESYQTLAALEYQFT